MWSDDIAKYDYLGFEVHANLIKGLIDEPRMLPITIGVFGDWGSGKSSIMESLKKAYEVEDAKGTLCLQFNGWVFEGYDDAKAALIEAILRAFKNNETLYQKVQSEVLSLAKSVKWMRVLGFGIKNVAVPLAVASLTGGASIGVQIFNWLQEHISNPSQIVDSIKGLDFDSFKEKYFKEQEEVEEQYQVVRKFREDFKDLLEKAGIKKLVVLIDDLDRCLPDRIIDNLEAIKLFLNVGNTAFVIGADPRIVRDAIRHRYTDLIERDQAIEENRRVVLDYLEKLIQVPYNLPKLSDTEVETYITLLFCEDTLQGKEEYMEALLTAFKEFRKTDRYSVFGYDKIKEVLTDKKLQGQLEKKVSLISKLSPLISKNLDGNPRQIKRFLNTFVLRKKLADAAQMADFKEDILAKLMILEYAAPSRYRELYSWQVENKGYAQELRTLEFRTDKGVHSIGEKYKEWNTPKMLKWLESDPLLANVDLRDYFWLSRDTLNSMSDSMTPPIVKTIIASIMIKSQSESVKIRKIKDDVKTLPEPLQQELYAQLVRNAAVEADRKTIFSLFELLIKEGCQCGDEFRNLCSSYGKKPAHKEIVNRIADTFEEFRDLKQE